MYMHAWIGGSFSVVTFHIHLSSQKLFKALRAVRRARLQAVGAVCVFLHTGAISFRMFGVELFLWNSEPFWCNFHHFGLPLESKNWFRGSGIALNSFLDALGSILLKYQPKRSRGDPLQLNFDDFL